MHIQDVFEYKARNGDSGFAIAYALMQVARANESLAGATERLGTGDAATNFGTIELLAVEVRGAGQAIERALLATIPK